jgi:hypothetical protein
MEINIETVIDPFAVRHPRRMLLLDILNSDNPEESE